QHLRVRIQIFLRRHDLVGAAVQPCREQRLGLNAGVDAAVLKRRQLVGERELYPLHALVVEALPAQPADGLDVMAGPGADDAHAPAQQIAWPAERRAVPEAVAPDQGAVAGRLLGFPRRLQIGDDLQVELARERVVLAEVARAHTYVQLPLGER